MHTRETDFMCLNDLIHLERQFQDRTESLFIQSFALTDQQRNAIRNLQGDNLMFYHLKVACYLRDFFEYGDGANFREISQRFVNGFEGRVETAWREIYHEDWTLNSVKSKCWILGTDNPIGNASNVWSALRFALQDYDQQIVEQGILPEDFHLMEARNVEHLNLLFSGNDTAAKTDFLRLLECLRDHHADGAERPWNNLVNNCRRILGDSAWIDYYVSWSGDHAQYIIGFDSIRPDSVSQYTVDHVGQTIPQRVPSYSHPINWSTNQVVEYARLAGDDRNTLNGNEANCLWDMGKAFGVLIKYMAQSARNDQRRFWWKKCKNQTTEMSVNQDAFMICAETRENLQGIEVSIPPEISCNRTDGEFTISNLGGTDEERIHYRKYVIKNRPDDNDSTITIRANDSSYQLIVKGYRPVIDYTPDESGLESHEDSVALCFAGIQSCFRVKHAREGVRYAWASAIDAQWQQNGAEATVVFSNNTQSIVKTRITCTDGNGNQLGGIRRVYILPSQVRDSLLNGFNPPANWQVTPVEESPILCRIRGYSLSDVTDPLGKTIAVRTPCRGFAWWFEIGHEPYYAQRFDPTYGMPRDVGDGQEGQNQIKLCMPIDVVEGSAHLQRLFQNESPTNNGYFRKSIPDILRPTAAAGNFVYDPESPSQEFRIDGHALFRYCLHPQDLIFCLDVSNHRGIFVPEPNHWHLVAYSDRCVNDLMTGNVLKEINTTEANCFIDCEQEIADFRANHQSAQCIFSIEPENSVHGLFFFNPEEGNGEGKVLIDPPFAGNPNQMVTYPDDMIPVVKILRERLANCFVLREARFLHNRQTLTYDNCIAGCAGRLACVGNIDDLYEYLDELFENTVNPYLMHGQNVIGQITEKIGHYRNARLPRQQRNNDRWAPIRRLAQLRANINYNQEPLRENPFRRRLNEGQYKIGNGTRVSVATDLAVVNNGTNGFFDVDNCLNALFNELNHQGEGQLENIMNLQKRLRDQRIGDANIPQNQNQIPRNNPNTPGNDELLRWAAAVVVFNYAYACSHGNQDHPALERGRAAHDFLFRLMHHCLRQADDLKPRLNQYITDYANLIFE